MKVRDLLQFEEIKKVIDIDSDIRTEKAAATTIKQYIITKDLKEHFREIATDLMKPRHNSFQIIGNYGSGKSHFLAVLAAIIDNPSLVEYLQDEELKEVFKKSLNRRFAVIQFELQPGKHSLSDFFYDRLEVKLKEKYGIEIPSIDTDDVFDHKEKVKEILDIIKSHNPQMGLMVIIDEISDFLKTKPTKELKYADTQFMRVLAQASNAMDFMFMGSMQENIFSSNEFVEEAESFGRTAQRYKIITISKEDIKNVLSKRALKKNISQVEQLKELLEKYGQQIPQVQSRLNQFVDLYPVHPYVIDIFNQLPYFENRGIIEFTTEQVKEILDRDFPEFVTYDKIYDKIASNHNIKTLDEIAPVINAVETLNSKIDLLREGMQEDARKIIKALAVLKFYGRTTNNGANPEELANELLIIDDRITNTDRIKLILSKLREVTDGQFINKTKSDYYYIDLEHDIDYDVVIKRKGDNLHEGAKDEELLKILKKNFDLKADSEYERVFTDYSYWKDKKSFRMGSFIYDDGSGNVCPGEGDFNFVFVSPYQERSKLKSGADTAILNIDYNDPIDELLTNIAAITALKRSSSLPKNVLDRKQKEYISQLEEKLLELLLNSRIENGGNYDSAGQLLAQEPDNLAEYYDEVKPALFNKAFNDKYPEYPALVNRLWPDNIQGEVERAMNDIFTGGERVVVSNSQNLLKSLELLDNDNFLDTSKSKYVKVIMKQLEGNEGKNIKIEDLINILSDKPFGLNEELVYLILIVLTYNGEINMKQRGGRTLTSSDLKQFFSTGLAKFKDVPYVSLETEFPVESIIKLFKILDLPVGLVRQKNDRPKALKEFKNEVIKLQQKIDKVENQLERLKNKPNEYLDITPVLRKREGLDNIPMNRFNLVNTINDFKEVVFDDDELDKLTIGLRFLDNISAFLDDFEEDIYDNYAYVKGSLQLVKENSHFFEDEDISSLEELAEECNKLIDADDLMPLLEYDQRRILKGKLEQYKRKYMAIYYRQHHKKVGDGINWDRLEEIKNDKLLQKLNNLKNVRGITTNKFQRLMLLINRLDELRCTKLKEEHLQETFQCTCGFPGIDDPEFKDINQTIDDISNKLIDINEEWQVQILSEIGNYHDNIDKLISSEQSIINGILAEQKLPEVIDNQVMTALNNLFSELEEVEVAAEDILNIIFKDHGVLDYNMFEKKLDEIREWVLAQGERENIRIKMKEINEEE
jgi:hypothetical protein